MSHLPTRLPSTTQRRQRFLQHLWSLFTGGQPRIRIRSKRLGRVESLEERRLLATMYALDSDNNLATFDSATPGTIASNVAITGLTAGELMVGIDTRPATGQLYGLGLVDDGATRTGRIYTINPTTGVATQVGAAPWSTTLADVQFTGFNFNPTVDRIRITNRLGGNFRVHPDTGALVAADTDLSQVGVNGVSYTNNDGSLTTTTLYGLLFDTDDLVTIGGLNGSPSPNGGLVTAIGDTGIVALDSYALEITNLGGATTAYATADGNLYTADLSTGALTLAGAIGGGATPYLGLTSALNTITVAGSGADDTLVVNATNSNSGTYSLNGGPAVPFANIASFSFIGGTGNDTLTINNPAGGLFAPARGIDFQGGGQAGDTLNLLGGGSAAFNETYFVGTTTPPIGAGAGNNGDGLLRFTGPNPVDIRFTGLAPIIDTVTVSSLTINATDAGNVINVTDGTASPRLRVSVDAFESIEFNNKTTVTVNADDGVAGGDAADTITVNQSNVPAALTTLNIDVREGDNTVTVLAVAGAYTLQLNGGANNDRFDASATLASPVQIRLNGSDGDDTLIGGADDDTFDGGGGNDTFIGNGGTDNVGAGIPTSTGDKILVPGTLGNDAITIAASGGSLIATVNGVTTTYRSFVGGAISGSGVDLVSVESDAGNDTVTVNSTDPTFPTNISTGAGDDSIVLADGVSLNGGTVDGGANTDTIDYSAYTTTVAVNLGSNAPLLIGTVEGAQENPAQNTTATGSVTLNYNNVAKTYDIHAQISNLLPSLVTGFHIHRAPVGVNGPIIVDLAAIFGLGSLVADGLGGFTFDALGVSLPAQHEAAYLGGLTYFNVHTASAPGGLIRGQIITNGNFVAATGTATGTAGIVGVENALGGSGADSLVGSPGINTLRGNAGNDTIVGAQGNDVMEGGDNNDSITWTNGDGTDVIEGGTGSDIVQVNGSIPLGDNFTVGANGTRVAFARTNLGLFTLDIGTTETLIVSGNGGDDTTIVNSLGGIADLTALNLAGLNGNDTFNTGFPVSSIAVNVNGGSHTTADTLNLDAASGPITDNGTQLSKAGSGPVNYSQIESLSITNTGDLALIGTAGDDTLTVNATGANAGTYRLNAGPTIAFSGMNKLAFNSLAGNDTLTINNPAGGLFAPSGGIDFNGGGQAGDALNLLGGGGAGINETYFVGTTTPPVSAGGNNGDGLIRFTGTSAVDIRFTGLAPVVDTVVAASLTVTSTDAANAISLTNGSVGPRLKVAVDAFEPIEFDNKSSLTINGGDGAAGGDGADTIDIDFSNIPAGLTQFNVNTDEGSDVVNVKAKAGATFSVFGNDGFNTLNVGKAGTLDGVVGGQLLYFGNPATFTDVVNINDAADTTSNTYIFNNNFFVRTGTASFGWTANVGQVTLNAGLGNDVINASGGFSNVLTAVNAGGGDDVVTVGFNSTLNFVAGPLTIAGEAGANDRLVIDDSANSAASTINVTSTTVTRVGRGTITYGTVEGLTVLSGTLADVINLASTSIPTSISTGAGDDSIVFANGVSLNGGTVDGGANTDTLDYSAYASTVAVNLGSNAPGLSGTVEGAQENPAQNTTAGGTVTLTYNSVAKTYDIHAQISNLAPNLVTGFHIHRAQVGVNGPIIVDLAAIFGLGSLVADGLGGFTFDALGVSLPAQHEAAFLGGLTYFNVHTAAAPGGLLRGQIIANGAFVAAPGTATGTAGIVGIENALGGTGVDSLVGDAGVNILRGNAGNDTIIGSQGNDTLDGGDNNDAITWSNGDNNDVIDGGLGADIVQVNGSVTAGDAFTVGANGTRVAFARTNLVPFTLDIGTNETLIVNGAGGDDSETVNSLAGVADLTAVNLAGLNGNDTFNTGFAVSPVVINVNGGSHTTGDTLNVDAAGGPVNDSGTQLSKPGFSPINYQQIESLTILNIGDLTVTGSGIDDTLVVNATSANAGTYRLNAGPVIGFTGMTKLMFNGLGGSDTLTIINPAGSLFAPTGGIDYNGGGQPGDSLNLLGGGSAGLNETYFVGTTTPPVGAGGNNGDGLIRFTGSSSVDIRFTGLAPIVDTVAAASLTVNSTDAANAINVTNAGVAPRLRVAVDAFEPIDFDNKSVVIVNAGDGIAGGDAADTINVNFSNLPAALTSLTVNADEGSDDINLTVVGNVVVPLLISGGLANNNSAQRDQLNITDSIAARAVAFDYQNGSNGDVNVNGIGSVVSVRQMESLVYSGNNATASVDGTTGTDDITVASALGAAMIFLGGNPWDGPVDGAFGSALPGVAGPGANKGPDIFARGLNQFSSISVTGGGGINDQLYFYGSSESEVLDPANAAQPVFRGLGLPNGVLIPGRGVGNAYDNISILPNQVFINTTAGFALIGVNLPNPTDFQQTNPLNPGLIVNAGDETAPAANGIADSIAAQLSSVFRLQVNGGNPPVAGAPLGDQMQIFTPGTAQVYSDKTANVTVTSPGVLGIGFTSIEQTLVTTGNGNVQLIGDNNDPAVEQTDNFIVVGQDVDSLLPEGDADGVGEFSLRINGDTVAPNAPALFFNRVQFLNVFGADLTGADAGQVDTLDVTPYADNTPRGWGISTFFDEDAPVGSDGNQVDLLIIHTSAFGGPVSEDIILQPSELDAGEVVIKNHSFGTPIAIISYIANTDIIVLDDDGSTTDTDTLTVRGNNADQANGLTGNNIFNADFTAAGDAANPIVTVFDGATQLFRLRTNPLAGAAPLTFNTINFETLGGNDTVNVVNRANGTLRVNVDGGLGNDTVAIRNTTAGTTTYTPGSSTDSGSVATPNGTVQLLGTELITLTGAVAGDALTANGTHDNDTIALQFLGGANRIWLNGQSVISFNTFGTVNLNGRFGDDKMNVLPVGLVGVNTINVNGGDPTASDELVVTGTAGVNNLTVDSLLIDGARVTGLGPVINVATTERLVYSGLGGNDTLTVVGTASNDTITHSPGTQDDSGNIRVNSLLAVDYQSLGATGGINIDGSGSTDTLVAAGTSNSDAIRVSTTGIVNVNAKVAISPISIEGLRLDGLEGDDAFNIDTTFTGPITVVGSTGLNTLTIEGVVAVPELFFVLPDVTSGSGSVNANTTVNYSGISNILLNGNLNDSLLILDTAQNNTWTVGSSPFIGDRTQLDSRETVDYFGFNDVQLVATSGVDTFVIRPTGLTGSATPLVVFGGPVGSTDDRLFVLGTPGNDAFVLNSNNGGIGGAEGTASLNGTNIVFGDITSVELDGLAGNDNFNVTPLATTSIFVDGGDPVGATGDTLEIIAPAGAGATTFVPGPTNDAGGFSFAGAVLPVSFENIEAVGPINLAAAGGVLVVCGTNASDDINVQGVGAASVSVSINDGPSASYAGVTSLTVQAKSGDDTIHVAPGLFTGLLNVDGGDPTASDKLIVSGTGANDAITYNVSNTVGSGSVLIAGSGTVNFTTTESLFIDGQGGPDALTVTSPSGHRTTVTPGSAADSGTIGSQAFGAGTASVPLSYAHIGATGTVTIMGAGDIVEFNGTANSDVFNVTGTTAQILNSTLGFVTNRFNLTSIFQLELRGLDGDDLFNVIGTLAAYTNGVIVDGGNPSASDVLNLTGATGAVTVNLANSSLPTDTNITGYGSTVTLTGIETAIVNAGNNIATVFGTAQADLLTYTPTGPIAGSLTKSGLNTTFNFSNVVSPLSVDGAGGADSVTVNGTSGIDVIGVVKGANTTVTVNALLAASFVAATTETLNVNAGDGNDTFNVSGTTASSQILNILGGSPTSNALGSSDILNITMSSAGTTAAAPGATPDAGLITSPDGTTGYSGIESFNLTGLAAGANTINVQGTHDNDTIALQLINGNRVWINDRAVYTFANYPTVNINGLFGDDKINVLPIGLVGVTTINVAGGDPTASDELVVSGSTGNDVINYNVSNTVGSGSVTITGAPVVNFTTTESLHIEGQGGTDALTVTSPTGHRTTVTPGTAADSGTIGSQAFGAGTASVPLNYSHIGATGSVTIAGSGDIVEFNGTENSDSFIVTGSTAQILNATGGNVTVGFNLTNIFSLELRGLDGDDKFTVTGSLAAYSSSVVVDGGNPSASDVLNLIAPTGAVVVNLATNSIAGYGATVATIGIETVNANAGTGDLTVNGTAGDDSLEVTPTGANSATFRLTNSSPAIGSTPVVNGSQIGTLSVDLLGGSDVLTVNGTTAGEAITVTGALVTVGTLETVNFAGTEALSVFAQQGADTITVTPGVIPVFIDGGDPIGVMPGDQLIVNAAVGFFAGPESDEGGVTTGGGTVSFDHIESITVAAIAGCPFLILGTNADDDITVIARDASTTVGADGVQDFTFSVNQGPSVVVLNQADLYIDAMAGDDDIVIRTAAPNEAAWDVNVRVAGGSPSIGAPAEADRLVLETPNDAGGSDDVVFNPTGADTGNFVIDKNANGAYDAAGTDSLITFGSFVFNCPPAAFSYTSTAGGVELIQYNGEGAPAVDDNLIINGTALDDTTILNPTGIGTGSFASGASPQFIFQSFDSVTVNSGTGGFDRVQVDGTEGPDVVTSNATTVTLGGLVTIGTGLDQLDINTFGGNDNVDLDLAVPGLAKFISVGAGNDIVNLLGVAVDPADPTIYGGDGDDFIIGSPNPDSIFGGTGNDILVGAGGIDQIYGEEGSDIFGNPSAVANGVADDAGNDFFHGGAGSDLFIWEPGDGSDIVEGGAGDADGLAFFGGAGAEVFNVFAKTSDPARAILFRNTGNITIDMAGIDQINVQGNAGSDAYVVGRVNNGDSGSVAAPTSPYTDPTASLSDLSTTEVRVVNIIEAIDAPDNVFVDGRPIDDNLTVTVESALTGVLRVAGLPYDVRISGTSTADRLTIRGNEGNDSVKAINSSNVTVEGLIGITFSGGAGNDSLSADAILIGGSGDDFLEGGAGVDQLFGNDGEDTMIGGAGADTFDGGAGFDTILVRGTLGNDAIDISQTADVTLVETVNGVVESDTLVLNAGTRTVERVSVEGSAGNDTIRVQWADSLGTDANVNSLRVDVDGGAGTTADRLGVVDLGTGDLILFEKGTTADSGAMAVGPGNAEPLIVNFTNVEVAQPVAGNGGDVVFFKHDDFEYNDARTLATYLGAGDAINIDPNINPGLDPIFSLPGDEDWFRVVAERTGVLDFQVYFRQVGPVLSGRPGLPNSGNLDIAVTDAAGNVIAGFGVNDATSDERVRIPAVAGQTYYLRVFANGAAINTYNVTVDNYAAPTPHDMELLDNPVGDPPPANSDTGRSQFDNVTRDNTPTLVFRLDDGILLNDVQGNSPAGNNPPNGVLIPIPFQAAAGTAGYRIAIFDEGSSPAPGTQVGTAPQVPLGFATFVSPGVYQFTTPVLTDGTHFLTARVQMVDPSAPQQTGFGDRSEALEIVVDTVIPAGFFGQVSLADATQGLDAANDSGVVGDSATFVDRVTNDTTPTFYGRAEANAIVRVYAETNGVAGLQSTGAGADLFLGLTVADPLDGTSQFPGGQWSFTTPLDLNNPNLGFAHDGARSIYMTSEDLAGNVTTDVTADRLNIFLDTAGAQVTDVQITGTPAFNLFGLKPDNTVEGPTPRVDSLTIRVQDFPNRSNLDPNFLYAALQQAIATTPGNFILKGDHTGIIAIQSITFIGDPTGNGTLATASILLNFFAPLPDDRYTLNISENVVDPVGNKLDGESNAAEPIGNPNFASGDGQPGGDFVARFTVDSRPEIGSISEGLIYVDINGNMVWDPEGQDNDATNRDFTFQFGQLVDAHFAGNFAPTGAVAASGFDKLGAYGKFAGKYSFILDTNDDGVGDFSSLMPAAYQVNGNPVAGDFNAAHPGDEIGLFDGSFWYLDTNGNNQIDVGERFASNFNGLPVVGDFNGDGNDDLAVFVNDTNKFIFDTNRDGAADFTWNVADQLGRFGGLSGFTDRPVAGDLNLDGIDDIGLWAKDRQGTLPRNSGEYFFWVSDRANANPANVFDSYSPAPLGNDLSAQFGDELALPIFGNFDPPVGTSLVDDNPLHRKPAPLDINGDGTLSPIDALLVINVLNKFQGLPTNDPVRAYYTIGQVKADSSGDRGVTPLDALLVINALNRKSNVGGEGEGAAALGVDQYQAAADDFFGQVGDNSDLELLKKRRS